MPCNVIPTIYLQKFSSLTKALLLDLEQRVTLAWFVHKPGKFKICFQLWLGSVPSYVCIYAVYAILVLLHNTTYKQQ
ncbi:CLUMA_CG012420, isoform A [Clunio marinus]|uniref:CLUMA_CG012420, isoform A n=1 Tax=Clunio marinus TaxID=568069 RepID=A0A1J1IGJ1_9DIPT|nr:CLUMA_CG012420, isoform A [Clunio marinus]